MPADGEGLLAPTHRLKHNSRRPSLPCGCGAGGIRRSIFSDVTPGEQLLQYRLAAPELRDDGIEFFAIFGNATIGGIIAVPTGGGVDGVELGKIDWGNVAGDAVDEKSSATLP